VAGPSRLQKLIGPAGDVIALLTHPAVLKNVED
jgi:hypothetical protein